MNTSERTAMKIDSNKLKKLRLEKSWSQEKLAVQADINLRTVQRIESEGFASLRSLESLAKALGYQPAELIYEKNVVERNYSGFPNKHALWLMVVAVIVLSIFGQIYGVLMELAPPVMIMFSFFPLFFISLLLLATQYPLQKYRKIIYISIIPIGMLFAPPDPLNQIIMMLICVLMYEGSNKAGAFFRSRGEPV